MSNGLVRGQLLIIESFADAFGIAYNALNNTNVSAPSRTMSLNDMMMLIWNGVDWVELSYTPN